MILGVFDDLKRSRVMAVDRNTFYPKNFLVIRWLVYFKMLCSYSGGNNCVDTRDSSAKIWCEDIKTSGIMCMKPSPSRLTGGCWSPVRMSVFFTTRQVAHFGRIYGVSPQFSGLSKVSMSKLRISHGIMGTLMPNKFSYLQPRPDCKYTTSYNHVRTANTIPTW